MIKSPTVSKTASCFWRFESLFGKGKIHMNFSKGVRAAVGCAAFLAFGAVSFVQADDDGHGGQSDKPMKLSPAQLRRISGAEAVNSMKDPTEAGHSANLAKSSANFGLPVWTYSVKSSRDGKTYTGQIVGQNPATGGTTSIRTYLIPVKLVFAYNSTTSYVFDPTATDSGCLGGTNTALSLTEASPILTPYTFTTGSETDTTQYPDHFNRANFWKNIGNKSSYDTLLTVAGVDPVTVTLSASNGTLANATVFSAGGQCGLNTGNTNLPGFLGVVNVNTWDPIAQSIIRSLGLNPSELPVFLFYNAVMSAGHSSNLNNCCILGYHNAVGSPVQTYAVAEFEGRDQTLFSGVSDVSSLSHEINEWMQDPSGANPTPAWGNVGQVSGCQNNYEVGDPLSGTLLPAIPGNGASNGFTYHVQELAFYSWFYGGPSIAANGWYSDNNTFKGAAKTCPPGGTN